MTEVRVAGTPMEIELIARSLGTDAKMRRRRDGGTFGYLEVRAPKVICLDCETTGLDPYRDEILSLLTVPGRRSGRRASCRGRWASGLCWMRSGI